MNAAELVIGEVRGGGAFVAFDGAGRAVLTGLDEGGGWWRVAVHGTARRLYVPGDAESPDTWREVARRALGN